jgi:DNA repair exonuclease SbcCD ATPase subunit
MDKHKLSASASDLQDNVDLIEKKESNLDSALESCHAKQSQLDGLVMQNSELASRLAKQQFEYNERERAISARVREVDEGEERIETMMEEKREETRVELEGLREEFKEEKDEVRKEFAAEYQARLKTLADEFAFVEREKEGLRREKENMRVDRELLFDIKVARGGGMEEVEKENERLRYEIKELNVKLADAGNSSPVIEKQDSSELMSVILSLTSYEPYSNDLVKIRN